MKTALRLLAIQNFIITLVLGLILVGLATFISSGEKLKSYISESGVYPFLATQISKSLKEAETPLNLNLQGPVLEKVANRLIDQTEFWINTPNAKAPEISLTQISQDLGLKEGKVIQEFIASQKEMLAELKTSPEMATPENQEMLKFVNNLDKNNGVFELDKQLSGLKWFIKAFPVMLIMAFGLALLSLLFILLLTPTWKYKVTWLFVTGLLTTIVFTVMNVLFILPGEMLSVLLASNNQLPAGSDRVLQSILLPIFSQFTSMFTLAVIVSGVFTAITLLARLLLFHNSVQAHTESPKKKSK